MSSGSNKVMWMQSKSVSGRTEKQSVISKIFIGAKVYFYYKRECAYVYSEVSILIWNNCKRVEWMNESTFCQYAYRYTYSIDAKKQFCSEKMIQTSRESSVDMLVAGFFTTDNGVFIVHIHKKNIDKNCFEVSLLTSNI
jgi:hypothetical protein